MNKPLDKQKRFEELLKEKGIHKPGGAVLVRRDEPGPYKLSFAQRRIWFLQQFDTTSGAYNDPTALRIKGPLNIPILEKTLNEIIRRHQVLRMIFPAGDGEVSQTLHKNDRIAISLSALENEPGKTIEDHIREFVNCFAALPFDFGKDLLIKAALLEIAVEDYVLVVNIHHIVLDGWSKGIMLQELMDIYQAFNQGKPSPLAELPIQYTDYVYWLHEWLKGKIYETQLNYWKTQLKGAPPLLELPTDFPRRGFGTGRGSIEPFSLSRETLGALNDLARQEDVTLFMLLLAVFNTLLYRYSHQEDILIGVPIAGRQRVELENLIGLFVNTLVMRTVLNGFPTFRELLGRIRSTALQSYQHQDLPFEKLVEELNPQRSLNITPLFQVMFQLQNAPMPPARISNLLITPIQVDTGFSQVDLSLTLWQEENIMKGTFEYSADLFTASTIKRMIGHFLVLLEQIIADPDQQVSLMSLLTEEEKRQLLVEWNNTDCDYPHETCISRLFENCAQQYPDNEAVIFNDLRLTYSQLDRQANRLSRFLLKKNISCETLAAICMENSLELITGVIGILKTGAAYIPMDPAYPDERLMAILKNARSPVLLTHACHLHRFAGYQGQIIAVDSRQDEIAQEDPFAYPTECKAENAACVIFTSGSSGEPKGIVIDNGNIVNLIYSFIFSYKPDSCDRILPLTSIASASFVGEILPILVSGGAVVLADKVHFLDMKQLTVLMSAYRVTILSTVPSMIARLNAAEVKPTGLRLLLSGGEALSPGDIDHLIDSVTIVNGYGLTEATICSTYIILNENKSENENDYLQNSLISVGKPIINTQAYILDKKRQMVPIGVPGEIYISGHGLSRGYLNNPELTGEKFISNDNVSYKSYRSYSSYFFKKILRTGDLGCLLPDGNIKFLGRLDTQVQIHGHRIELSEIETHLGLHPDIQDVVVVDREVPAGDHRLVAYLVARDGKKPAGNQLRDWLDKRIPDYMIPALFEWLPQIPLNANGKVDPSALPEPSWRRPELDVAYRAPQTAIEKSIVQIWQEILHLEKVGVNDNFFDLGGHSLLLTQILSRLNRMYHDQKTLTIVDLFRFPTIHSLSKYLSENKKQEPADTFQKIQARADKQRQAFSRKQFKV